MAAPSQNMQSNLLDRVLSGLESLGFQGELLQRQYDFDDWFLPDNPRRTVPAAAFGQTPLSYDNACFSVLLAGEKAGLELIHEYRALGSPLAFEVVGDHVNQWVVGAHLANTRRVLQFSGDQIEQIFQDHEAAWSPNSILRAKNIGGNLASEQLDLFIDQGLIPALEEQIMPKLDRMLREVLDNAQQVHMRATGRMPNVKKLFRLIFRMLAAKVLHDRGAPRYRELTEKDFKTALAMVATYYGESAIPIIKDRSTQQAVAQSLWKSVDFRNLSVEVLAYIYENTLVDDEARRKLSTHSTPHGIARYIVRHLPIRSLPEDQRRIVEPCSGHGIFLVAGLQRLRELLGRNIDPTDRHQYFVSVLRGFEIDAFACEVSRLCLMLADFPNHNGWRLANEDIFLSQDFNDELREAKIVLCNPPFGMFTSKERDQYGPNLRSLHKPAEIIHRVLDNLPPGGMLGFVLPHQFIDGQGYREVRRRMAEHFETIQIVDLPEEHIFHTSRHKAVLVLASGNLASKELLAVDFREVAERDLQDFISRSSYTRKDRAYRTPEDAEESLAVTVLNEVWELLSDGPRLGQFAEIHRGLEWWDFNADRCYATTPKQGFEPGYGRADTGDLQQYIAPPPIYLNVDPAELRGGAIRYSWSERKVVVNAARISINRWRYVAFIDRRGLLCTQNFHGVWPMGRALNLETLAAILNNPLAAAFVASHENGRHITRETLRRIPVPVSTKNDQRLIKELVHEYIARARQGSVGEFAIARDVLREIDATVLRLYNLPSHIEQELITFFRDQKRPLPFSRGDAGEDALYDMLVKLRKVPDEEEREQRETWRLLQEARRDERVRPTRSSK